MNDPYNTTIKFDNMDLPALPFLWYRENHIMCPIKNIELIGTPYNKIYKITQYNVLENPSLYISFHTISYYIDTKNTVISSTFNKSYRWECTTYTSDPNMIFINGPSCLSNKNKCSGNAIIHDNSFSPPGDFKFSIKTDCKEVSFMVNCICSSLGINITCFFTIINDLV